MTILLAYVARPEGEAALEKGIEMAKLRNEFLLVVNATAGGSGADDPARASVLEVERLEQRLATCGVPAEFKQFVRGRSALEEIEELVQTRQVSLLVMGLRRRSPVGKLILGSMAQDILMTIECPILVVKAA